MLTDFSGNVIPVQVIDGKPVRPMTVKDVFLTHLGLWNPKEPLDHIKAYALGSKLVNGYKDGETLLEDAEYEMLKKAMAEPRSAVMVYAPAKEVLDAAKKEEVQ